MNTGHDFDAKLRRVHGRAVARVSPRTLVQLRPQHVATPHAHGRARLAAWPLAATCAIALVAAGVFLRQPGHDATRSPAVTTTTGDPVDVYTALDESPELYLWLASNDTYLALE